MSNSNNPQRVFHLVWKWQGLERIQSFLWLVSHESLLMNAELIQRHLAVDASCLFCKGPSETVMHALRDYNMATFVWARFILASEGVSFFAMDKEDWLITNLSKGKREV